MPRITLRHETIIRIMNALITDNIRREEFAVEMEGTTTATMEREIIAENERIMSAFNRVRAKDGLLPISYRAR